MAQLKSQKLDRYVFSNCGIYCPLSKKTIKGNILIIDGIIEDLNFNGDASNYNVVECKEKIICPSFLDLRCHFSEPGFEDTESLNSGAKAAIAGGYSKICMLPNTYPVLDSLDNIESLYYRAKDLIIDILPIGSITKGLDGIELSEIGLMAKSGIVAISDAHKMVENSQILRNAIEYSGMFGIPVINHPENMDLKNSGIAHESLFSTEKGIPSIPSIAETVAIYRDLEIANYVNGKIHIPHVSCSESVKLISRYKDMGLDVTAEVTPHHLGLTQFKLGEFDARYKISPPLRSEEDRLALVDALKTGVIDCISSDHFPHKIEDKESDLINSKSGVIGLESAFSYSYKILSESGFSIEQVIDLFAVNSRKIINVALNMIEKGSKADFIIIDPNIDWTFETRNIFSKSKNSALIGEKMKGKIEAVAFKNKFHIIE
ncbi:MAG: dihydroorotase [Candidatus Marinimicrobia bacterium]|mgnify:FL=1|nr:dihydroorotase [Candidatus Neomarinimicrobiota bacterium]|tara:strand:- start:12678 stop:13973 length:1296 start_codon:yes stop_codon:yes gene_type:complete